LREDEQHPGTRELDFDISRRGRRRACDIAGRGSRRSDPRDAAAHRGSTYADVFDAWYYTEGGFAGNIPTPYNEHALITGRQDGLEIQPTA
jgi:hypothetical protein